MTEWKETTLAELCTDISYGYTESAKQEKIGPKFLRITDIASGRLDWSKVPYCPISEHDFKKYNLLPGDIVIARTGATTGVNYTIKESDPKNVVFASYLIRYKINQKIADPYFIGQLLRSPNWTDYVDAIAGGSAQPGANAKQLGSFEISLPELPVQTAIASVLSSLDDKIDLLHRQNATLEKMAETLFRQWFVEEVKEDWEENKVRDIAEHLKVNVVPSKQPSTFFHHYSLPAFDASQNPIREVGIEILSNKYKVFPESILVSKLNPSSPRIWAIGTDVKDNSICSTEFQVFKPQNIELFGYLFFLLKSEDTKNALKMSASGTSGSHQRVRPEDISNIPFALPNIDLAIEFSKHTQSLLNKINKNQIQIRTLTALRDTLLPKLMSGEVSLNTI